MSSTAHDIRGNPVGSPSKAAQRACEHALWQMMSFAASPLAELDGAIAAEPGWLLPRAMKAGFLLGLAEPARIDEARALLDDAEPLEPDAPARERAHHAALRQLLEGRWQQACQTWDELLLAHPRDALALHWGQWWDFQRGDAASLRLRPARALPEWDEADPLYPYVLGLYAFGLEQCNLHPQAEEIGRRALTGDECVPWAVHAVAHVMEVQGRFDDGAAWLRQHQPLWAEGNAFAPHLWTHLGLFRLEALDLAGALRLADAHLGGDTLSATAQRADAAALLWRLRLLGADVHERFRTLVDGWPMLDDEAGFHAFNDLHALVALLGADDLHGAERWLARCAERAMQPEDARRSNHAVAREVGLPTMRALLALARGDAAGASAGLFAVRRVASRLGGGEAAHELIDQTLLAACAAEPAPTLARAVLNERLMAKPATPLTRWWAERVATRDSES
jgi:hypothetical protein